jgi:hypothetical protein
LSRYSPHLQAPPLLELLLTHKSKKSTDPKDKVIALVGISQSRESFGPIDYSQSVHQIYTYTARHIISSSHKLDVICVKQNDYVRESLPTWVPDWARPPTERRGIRLPLGLHHREPKFSAAGDSIAEYEFLKNGYVLRATGFKLDNISAVGMAYKHKGAATSVEPALHVFHDWWNLFAASVSHPQSSSAQAMFARSISCGHWAFEEENGTYEEKLRSIFNLSESLLAGDDVLRIDTPPHTSLVSSIVSLVDESDDDQIDVGDKEQIAVAIQASTFMNRRRFFISSDGIVGLAPWDATEGDIIAVLLGCQQPVVLREVNGYYKLIGEAYVDGYMDGKALHAANEGRLSKEIFEIH